MKLTTKKLKEMIQEQLDEMYVTDIAGSDEDRAVARHQRAKRARGQYPPRPNVPYQGSGLSPEEAAERREQAMVQATISILNMDKNAHLSVDPATYAMIEKNAPELLDRVSVNRRREE